MSIMNAKNKIRFLPAITAAALVFLAASGWTSLAHAQADSTPLPRLATQDGRHALIVDGDPFLILGAQCHNSSAWPAMLPKVWPAIESLHANTLEIPVYWEQFEPDPGRYDTSIVDTIIQQAREHDVRIVLLWFGTWKNGSSHYLPLWLKKQPEQCPRIIGKDGRRVDSPSPHSAASLEADRRAFCALLRHLKANDPVHTVIMIQVENEPGSWNTIRDYSPEAQKLFTAAVPAALLKAMGRNAPVSGTWPEVFGANADEYFHAWSVARYIEQVAAAGKAENPLPIYVNVALRDPLTPGPAGTYESGGATDNVLWIWKAASPSIDLLAPDIYQSDSARYLKVLELYSRPDNALFVPETMGTPEQARMCFAALGHGAIGWSPFGLDYSIAAPQPPGAPQRTDGWLAPIALNYEILRPIMREIARLNFEGKLQTVVEQPGELTQTMDFGNWQAVVTYGVSWNSPARGNPEPVGRALVAKTGENEFLVTGAFCRVDFKAASGGQRDFVRVEEGGYEKGVFRPMRIWNGDETDWGLDFRSTPQALRVLLGTY
jgi:hypothetical protein